MADSIQTLPTDDSVLKNDEIEFFTSVFKTEKTNKFVSNNKEVILAGVLVFIFLIPAVQSCIRTFVEKFSGFGNEYFIYFVTSVVFMAVFFFTKNIALSKRE